MSQPWAAPAKSKPSQESVSVRITQQFRERHNMTYELDCSGVPLVLRIFFPVDSAPGQWRIEAHARHQLHSLEATASAQTRAEALGIIARDWHSTLPETATDFDWDGIARAMAAVRAT
jgi:hypothetical protein